jgi:glutamine---fructose-6-phosphate transaminase (isomerizing)
MCGIIGYNGNTQALPILIQGLKALEYRGYDSAGVALLSKANISCKKKMGSVEALEQELKEPFPGTLGIAHTRWATHGAPNSINAHPHQDCTGRIAVVHNGIIENYRELRASLSTRNHNFISETDTEVIPHLIEDLLKQGKSFKDAFFQTLSLIKGAYALLALDTSNPKTLYAARLSSPLVIGLGEQENFAASDPTALVGKTKKIVYLKDGHVAEINKEIVRISDLKQQPVSLETVELEWNLEQTQKGNFPHFMLKEIFEEPEAVRVALAGRLKAQEGIIKLGGLEQVADKLSVLKHIHIIGCGTAYYAGLVGQYLFEDLANIPSQTHLASEFRYRRIPLDSKSATLVISQSGETADTLAALRKAKDTGLLTLGIVNVVNSSIARETDAGIYNHAGPEVGVASTKAFLSQLSVLTLMGLYFSKSKSHDFLLALEDIPKQIELILKNSFAVKELATRYKDYQNFLFLGRGYNYPVALEGALKLKEVSYVHAEGYAGGEMKHGSLAIVNPDTPIIALVPHNSIVEKMYSNIEEVKARGGKVLAIATEGDTTIQKLADDVFFIPQTKEQLEPFLSVVPLHLFAYYMGTQRGYNVDKPRNLAKSVTVE